MAELKHLDYNIKQFTANGVNYYIENTLSIARFEVYQKLELESAFGVSFKELFDRLNELYSLLNQTDFVRSAVLVHNLLNGLVNFDNNEIQALRFCTLFINAKDEDRGVYDEIVMKEKIDNWKKEGIEITFFLNASVRMISGFTEAYKQILASTSLRNQERVHHEKN